MKSHARAELAQAAAIARERAATFHQRSAEAHAAAAISFAQSAVARSREADEWKEAARSVQSKQFILSRELSNLIIRESPANGQRMMETVTARTNGNG